MISTTSLWVTNLVVLSIVLFHVLIPLHVFADDWMRSPVEGLTPYPLGTEGYPNGTTSIRLDGTDAETKQVDFYFDFDDPANCRQDTMTCICLEMLPDKDGMIGNGHTQSICPGMTSWCLNWPNGTADWLHLTDSVLLRKQLTISVDGVDGTGQSQLGLVFPANVTLIFNGLEKNKVNVTTDGQSKLFAIKAARSVCPFTVKLQSANAYFVVPAPTTLRVINPNTTLPANSTSTESNLHVAKAGLGFAWWAILVTVAVLLFAIVTILYFLLVCLMWKRRGCFKNMDRHASANSALPEKSNGPKNKAAPPADAQANDAQPKGSQPKNGKDKRAPAGHDSSKPKPMARQQEDAVTRQQEDGQQEDVLAVLDFDYINIGNVVDVESTSQSHRNTVRAKDDPFKKTHIEPPKEEPQMLQPIIAPEPSFSQALFNGQMSELRPTFFKAFIAATVVYVILVLLILAGWAAAFVMFPDYLGLGWAAVR